MVEKTKNVDKSFEQLKSYLVECGLFELISLYKKVKLLKNDLAKEILNYSIEDLYSYDIDIKMLMDDIKEEKELSLK